MQIIVQIPDDLAGQLLPAGSEPSRLALEALATEGYRSERLSEAEIQRLLGFETRIEVHAFLKERGAFLHYSLADAERDRQTAQRARRKLRDARAQRAG